jgi:hypothetical protein
MSALYVFAGGAAALVGVFLFAFTGACSPTKNRVAIGFSYVVVLLALASPFLLVDEIASYPGPLESMKRAPVGLVLTTVHNHPQWVLNIGGQISQDATTEQDYGLVVPLYVIVLAVVGAAINMTRQVPRFQPESERAGPVIVEPASLPFGERRRRTTRSGRRRESWRTGLLTQYMYLISAPFLAIAAYYLLVWTGTDSKTSIVVLVAFSVGIVSDPVLKKVTDVGYSFIRQKPKAGEPQEGAEAPAERRTERKPPASMAAGGG